MNNNSVDSVSCSKERERQIAGLFLFSFQMDSITHIKNRQSRHYNVSGVQILLSKKSIGESVCMEYIIEKEKLPLLQYPTFLIFTLSVALLAVNIFLSYVWGMSIFALVSILLMYQSVWDIDKEILLVTAPIGVQFTTFFKSGQQTTCFIPWHHIKDVYIVEAISLQRVLYNLVIMVECCELGKKSEIPTTRLIPLFQGIKPRLDCIESIYQSIYDLLPQLDSLQKKK